ncbi:Mediator of RNA polymerase II transcription subunit 33B [Dionaea muscipula]
MPVVASLWTQKVKRWSDFLIFSASRTIFLHNKDAVVQLLKSCFKATTLGLGRCSVGTLLGNGFGSHFTGGISPVAPGILYLRVYRSIREIMALAEEFVSLMMLSVKELVASNRLSNRKDTSGTRYRQFSLAEALTQVKIAASLGAALLWLSGGSCLVQCLIKETLPSWFMSFDRTQPGAPSMLGGYALAYFAVLCGAFAWGVDSSSSSKRRKRILGHHMKFLASALDGKISLGCDPVMWHAYVSGFVSLMVGSLPSWVLEADDEVLKRLSQGLRRWNEEELAFSLLAEGGIGTMGAAAELIIETDRFTC